MFACCVVVFSPQLYVTFWALSMFDLYVPSERYEQELSKLKQQQAQLDDNKDMVCSAMIKVDLSFLSPFCLSCDLLLLQILHVLVTCMKQNTSEMMLCFKSNRLKYNLCCENLFTIVMI